MEIVTKTNPIRRVIFQKAKLNDYIIFTVVFGLFSIFGTYIGTHDSFGIHLNIRDIAPMVAGLVAGPIVGFAVGLIGGAHRLYLGGVTDIPCSLATILAGSLAGLVYHLNKGKILGTIPAMIFAAIVEVLHAGLILLLARPFDVVYEFVFTTFPQMIIAVTLGMGICIIIVHSTIESCRPVTPEKNDRT